MTTANFGAKITALEIGKGVNAKLDNKVFIVTCNISIGIKTTGALATANAHVFITARNMNKGAQFIADIKKTTDNSRVKVLELDLTSSKSVRTFVTQFRACKLPINILICNAGIMACLHSKTTDRYESQFGVNHLAHFLLTISLIHELKAGKLSRVLMFSSAASKFGGINWEKTTIIE